MQYLQDFYVYKINVFNSHETPWEGTRICKKKFLKSFSHLRKKVLKKNISKPFWKLGVERNIEIIPQGGWHFNNLYSLQLIRKKIMTFPHSEYQVNEYTDLDKIKSRIENLEDLFDRGYKFEKVVLNKSFPEFILENQHLFKEHIL